STPPKVRPVYRGQKDPSTALSIPSTFRAPHRLTIQPPPFHRSKPIPGQLPGKASPSVTETPLSPQLHRKLTPNPAPQGEPPGLFVPQLVQQAAAVEADPLGAGLQADD